MPTGLVTGAAGFIGSNLSEELLNRGYTVRGVDNFATGRQSNLSDIKSHDDFTFQEADIRDEKSMKPIIDGVDYIFHQAAVPSVPRSVDDPITTTDANCTGTATVLDLARHADVDTVIVASSSSVYGSTTALPKKESMESNPESPYALSKYYTEKLALQCSELYDINTVALRYFNIFGPKQDPNGAYAAVIPKFIRLMLDGENPVIYGDGEQSRDFTYIKNAIDANIMAAESEVSGEVFNIGCDDRFTINELVNHLNDILDTEIQPEYDSPRPGDVRHSHADISKAKELIDYNPAISFVEGLKRTADYYSKIY